MRIICGSNVDLICPFPIGEVRRTYGWNHCYRTLTETDDTPNSPEIFIPYMESVVQSVPSWGIIDKNHITNIKHEAPLVGIIIFEPAYLPNSTIVRNGFFHVATARKAWRTGLVDEAGQLVLQTLFSELPTLLRVSGYVMEKNFPAKALCKRMGFKFEGLMEDAICKSGVNENMVLYGLTRRNYDLCQVSSVEYSEPTQKSQPQTNPVVEAPLSKEPPPLQEPLVDSETPLLQAPQI